VISRGGCKNSIPGMGIGRIDGPPTRTGVAAGIQPLFNSVSVMDASNDGWGGIVRFDNIDITRP
jgi:hypothetical protein